MTYAVTLTAQDGADIYYEIAEGKDKAPVPTTKSKKFETYQYGQIEITQPTASKEGPVTKIYNIKAISVKKMCIRDSGRSVHIESCWSWKFLLLVVRIAVMRAV